VGFGSFLTIGYKCDDRTSREMVALVCDKGLNFFDAANIYNAGQAEIVLGRCLKDYPRSSLFVLSKVWGSMGAGPNDKGLSAKHIFEPLVMHTSSMRNLPRAIFWAGRGYVTTT